MDQLNSSFPTLESSTLLDLLFRLTIDIIASIILIRFIYYYYQKNREYVFTYFLFNIIIFFVTFLFKEVEVGLGFAFGLFAIFGIIRYRTRQLPIKEMTYLYTVIAIALINGLANLDWKLGVMILCILLITYIMEKIWYSNHLQMTEIRYDRLDIIENHSMDEVLKDLRRKTKLNITKVDILTYDFVRGSAELKIYYLPEG